MANRELFSSTTGDADYGLFFTPRDMDYFNQRNTELLEIVAKTKVKYWKIEKDHSDPNDIYGESDSRLTEVGIVPMIGDFIEYDNQFFEILSADVPTNVYSYEETKLGVIVKCISIREDVFAGHRDTENTEVDNDSANPY